MLVVNRINHIPITWGESVKALLECDAVYFVFDWAASKGCMAEFEIARVYGKQIMMQLYTSLQKYLKL